MRIITKYLHWSSFLVCDCEPGMGGTHTNPNQNVFFAPYLHLAFLKQRCFLARNPSTNGKRVKIGHPLESIKNECCSKLYQFNDERLYWVSFQFDAAWINWMLTKENCRSPEKNGLETHHLVCTYSKRLQIILFWKLLGFFLLRMIPAGIHKVHWPSSS